jgi:hypothetical protein
MEASPSSSASGADLIASGCVRRRLLAAELWGASLIEAGTYLLLRNFGLTGWGAFQIIGIASFVVGLTAIGAWVAALPRPTTTWES